MENSQNDSNLKILNQTQPNLTEQLIISSNRKLSDQSILEIPKTSNEKSVRI